VPTLENVITITCKPIGSFIWFAYLPTTPQEPCITIRGLRRELYLAIQLLLSCTGLAGVSIVPGIHDHHADLGNLIMLFLY